MIRCGCGAEYDLAVPNDGRGGPDAGRDDPRRCDCAAQMREVRREAGGDGPHGRSGQRGVRTGRIAGGYAGEALSRRSPCVVLDLSSRAVGLSAALDWAYSRSTAPYQKSMKRSSTAKAREGVDGICVTWNLTASMSSNRGPEVTNSCSTSRRKTFVATFLPSSNPNAVTFVSLKASAAKKRLLRSKSSSRSADLKRADFPRQ